VSDEPLQPNPFITYRDPNTGLWLVIRETVNREKENNHQRQKDTPAKCSFLRIESV
jgi:hypothetical protein